MKKNIQYLWLLAVIFFAMLIIPAPVYAQPDADDQILTTLEDPPGSNVALVFDGSAVSPAVTPIMNQEGRTLIDASQLAGLLDLELEWADNEQLFLTRGQIGISFRNGQNIYSKGDQWFSLDTVPYKSSTVFFIPLRAAAEEFGFTVDYDADTRTVYLYSVPPAKEVPAVINIDFPQDLGLWGAILPDSDLAALWGDENVLGGYFTRLNNSPPNRTKNIILACSQINGTLVKSGDVFSFNQVVGPRIAEKGYLPASIFVGRQVVPGTGGGICQVSSTLYNSALTAGLEIVERHPHTLSVNYVASGYDATVLWGAADFKFKNDREKDLLVLTAVYGNYVVALFLDVA